MANQTKKNNLKLSILSTNNNMELKKEIKRLKEENKEIKNNYIILFDYLGHIKILEKELEKLKEEIEKLKEEKKELENLLNNLPHYEEENKKLYELIHTKEPNILDTIEENEKLIIKNNDLMENLDELQEIIDNLREELENNCDEISDNLREEIENDFAEKLLFYEKNDFKEIREEIENEFEEKKLNCCICKGEESNIVFTSCGHLCSCSDCFNTLLKNSLKEDDKITLQCPLCRNSYLGHIRIFK